MKKIAVIGCTYALVVLGAYVVAAIIIIHYARKYW